MGQKIQSARGKAYHSSTEENVQTTRTIACFDNLHIIYAIEKKKTLVTQLVSILATNILKYWKEKLPQNTFSIIKTYGSQTQPRSKQALERRNTFLDTSSGTLLLIPTFLDGVYESTHCFQIVSLFGWDGL